MFNLLSTKDITNCQTPAGISTKHNLDSIKIKKPFSFSKKDRLLTSSQFQKVFSESIQVVHTSYFVFIIGKNEVCHHRLGLSISKKRVKKAMTRNQLKRIIRESFRTTIRVHSENGHDIVVVAKGAANTVKNNRAMIRQSLEQFWGQWL